MREYRMKKYCLKKKSYNEEVEKRMTIPDEARSARIAYLPPMSGLADHEFVKQP